MRPKIAIPVAADELAKPNARAKYRNAIELAGGEPVLIASPQYLASVPDIVERFDGVLLPGGGDIAPELYGGREHPAVEPAPPGVDAFQIEIVRAARRSRTPLLGICRGIQVMNVALGGTLYEDIDGQYDAPNGMRLRHQQTPDLARDVTSHRIEVTEGSLLASLLGTTSLETNTLHHQAVRRVAADLAQVALARDGTVEGLELREGHPCFVGVQWHPEELAPRDEPSRSLFSGFVARAAERAQRRTARAS
jgi:putative glutamine amidotransferase